MQAGDVFMRRPGFDPELRAGLAVVGGVFPPTITPDLIPFMRRSYASPPLEQSLAGRSVTSEDVTIKGFGGVPLTVSVLRNPHLPGPRPGMLYAHSGGMVFGDRFSGLDQVFEWVEHLGLVVVTPEYRRAPEHPDPFPREDCYAALEWMAEHADQLQIRSDRLAVGGASAGGGLAAGLALAARDRNGPGLCAQLLDFPMLDDRGLTGSTSAFDGVGVWDRTSNETGWTALLGEAVGGPDVSPYAAPARAVDLRGLPPAFLSVGEAEIFRDETVAYASGLWSAGVHAELHVWPGGFHAFDIFAPHTALARSLIAARNAWLERLLSD